MRRNTVAQSQKGFEPVLLGLAKIDALQNRAVNPTADFSKWVEPSAIAGVILFLASDASRAISGAAIPVFGKG